MTKTADILHDLDLLDDWLSAKGYADEAGLVFRAFTLIHEQEKKIEKQRAALNLLIKSVELAKEADCISGWDFAISLPAAKEAAALKETGE